MYYINNILITFAILFIGNHSVLNGMLSCVRNIKIVNHRQLFRLHHAHNHKNLPLNESIQNYQNHRDEKAVKEIALENIFALVSIPLGKNYNDEQKIEIIEREIIFTAKNSNYFSKVYRENEKTIGFINYGLHESWYSKTFPNDIGLNAKIYHLAIKKEYKSKGYGTDLLNHALEDCKKMNAHSVSLWTTGGSFAGDYYKKKGFDLKRRTKLNEEQWEMLIQPSHAKIIMNLFIKWLKNKIK
jgi:GNAT superfamily N-acetyltransferase